MTELDPFPSRGCVVVFTKSLALEVTPYGIRTEDGTPLRHGSGITEAEEQAAMDTFVLARHR